MTVGLSIGELVIAALDELVATIAATGTPATRDPSEFQPPGAIVTPATITAPSTLGTVGVTVPVWIVAADPGRDAHDWSIAAASELLLELGESQADPTSWISPINPDGLPAYLIHVRMNISQEG